MDLSPEETFTLSFGLTEVLGALLLILSAIWLSSYRGGFAWTTNIKLQFNWHPLLMIIGMIFLYGNAILVYRTFRNCRKKTLKFIHTSLFFLIFIVVVIGLQAVFDSHNLATPPLPNMYTLHSWIGIITVIMFVGQWLLGFIFFLFPTMCAPLRATYFPYHVYFGMAIFVCAGATALIGLTEKAIFALPDYKEFPSEGLMINSLGILISLFVGAIIYLASEKKFKRQPLPEDEMLLSSEYKAHAQRPSICAAAEKPHLWKCQQTCKLSPYHYDNQDGYSNLVSVNDPYRETQKSAPASKPESALAAS